ncbi:MAG: ATP-dependent zinc metalloprotease FtsH [Clostridia bacterium]|nr:ATP-dependent zinc metalloprotease FtsH [Clostridia bacterium]
MFSGIGLWFLLSNTTTEINVTEFHKSIVEDNKVVAVSIEDDIVSVQMKGSSRYEYSVKIQQNNTTWLYNGTEYNSLTAFITAYNENNSAGVKIAVSQNDRNEGSFVSYIFPVVGFIILIVLAFFLFRSMNGTNRQAMNFGKSKANILSGNKTRFTDVAGAEEEKEELKEIVDFLKSPQKFTTVGARIPRGVLLVGPPGTGKTLFAKAVAGEANVPFFSISGSDFVEMYVGVGASRVRDLFENAKRNMPCIIFIDEIDAVGRQRGAGLGGGHDEREQTLNQLLVQMDGFATNDGIIVMAATNRADILDPALLRPGRFDRQIYVNIPDVRGREAIFKVHARNKPVASDVDFQILARITSGFSGADIANLLNEAAILCARDNRNKITMEDIYEGINKVVMGPQKKSRLVTEVDKRITAYHESGHALVARLIKDCDPVHEVSIIPRGQAAGYTMTRPDNDDNHITINKLKGNLAMTMGGRAAEEIVIKDISAGAVGDITHATSIARKMVMEWGMSEELGPVYYGSNQEVFLGRDYQSTHSYSESVASKIDKEVATLVETAYKTALNLLTENQSKMDVMVRVLMQCETIYTEEVDLIMQGATADEVIAELNERLSSKKTDKKQ